MRFIVVAVFGSVLVACAGTLDADRFGEHEGDVTSDSGGGAEPSRLGDAMPPSACADVPTAVLGAVCGGACHSGATPTSNLDLTSPNVAQRLLGKPALAGGGLLIDPIHPEASVLYTKVTRTPPFGGQMPPSPSQPLDDATAACVRDWVRTAARQSAPADAGADG
jgi:hypothetical protein